ncbi:MAG: 1-acyl-sn-glycerol-3-phosphate acyltransferase, partial [Thermodesulfobacterium sp.]|nr:1-acyl-sn-glycerol-3-phosphate acyltransferase [Thermodesulfobacterium sp.]
MQEKIAKLMFNLFWRPVRFLLSYFLRLEVESQENLEKLKGPLIIASDHHSSLDPFILGASFPKKAKIFPIRYGTWYKYYYFPLFFPIVSAFGAFPVYKGDLEKVLKPGVDVLKSGGTVGIFPEGKRRHLGRPPKARRGVAYLALKTNSPILPIHIEVKFGI